MARSRNIKPGFFTNEELPPCGPHAHLLFAGLWGLADREGRLEDRPLRIKIQTLPFYDVDVDKLLDCLAERGFILRYSKEEKLYIQILNFEKHQNPHKNEASSTIPAPESSSNVEKRSDKEPEENQSAQADSFNLIPDSLNSDSLNSDSLGKTSSAPQVDAEPEIPVFITIPLVDKSEYPITYADLDQWQESYPGIKVDQMLRTIRQWNLDNPKNRKTKTGIRRHINNWLAKEQNRAPRVNNHGGARNEGKAHINIHAAAADLGLSPNVGESMDAYKARVMREHARAARSEKGDL